MKRTNLTTVLLTLSLVLVTFPQIEVRAEPNTIAVPDDYATIQEAVDAASDGGFALAGRTANLNDENSDFWVLKTDEYGIPEFPSWAILPLLVVGTLLAVLSKNRLRS